MASVPEPSKSEAVLLALFAKLEAIDRPDYAAERNLTDPPELDSGELAVLYDGTAEPDDALLGNQGPFYYRHTAEIDLLVAAADPAERDRRFDALKIALGGLLDADPTLGGLIEGMTYGQPVNDVERREGATGVKSATLDLELSYFSQTRL